MTAAGLLLVLLSGVSWGALDSLRKGLSSQIRPLPLSALLTAGQLPIFGVWASVSGGGIGAGYWLPGVADAACALTASVLFVAALRASPLSVSIPMLSLTPVFALGIAGALLGEHPSGLQLLGVALVVGGALLLNRPRSGRGWFAEPGVWMMTAVSALWATTITLDKMALAHASSGVHALTQAVLIVAGLLAILAARRELRELAAVRTQARLYVPAVLFLCLATGAQLMAVQAVLVSLVEAIKRAIGLAMAVLNGRLFFNEPITAAKLGAIVLLTIGVALLSVGAG